MSNNILVLGSNYITSAIVKSLLYLSPGENKITVIDRRDPHYVLNQNLIQGIQALSSINPDLKKGFEYTKGFSITADNPLSFLFVNPLSDSIKIYQELSKLSDINIIIDTAMMNDEYYSESNIIDTCNLNTTYPASILSILSKLPTIPLLYINLSSSLVYGRQKVLPTKEDVIPNPSGIRAGSILARENIVSSLCRRYDIPFITLRIGDPIGYYTPYENVINQIVKHQLLKEPIIISGDGSQSRDFFDLNDLGTLVFKIVSNTLSLSLPSIPAHQKDESKKEEKRLVGSEYVDKIKNQVYNIGGYKTDSEAPYTMITLDRLVTVALGDIKIPESQGKIIIKNSRTKNTPWRHSESVDNIQIHMDIKKAMEVLEYDPEYNLLSTIKTEVIPYIASNFLGYDDEQMEQLKNRLRV